MAEFEDEEGTEQTAPKIIMEVMMILRAIVAIFLLLELSGCGGMLATYHLDKYVDQNIINALVEKPQIVFWISDYQYDDKAWKFKNFYGLANITPRSKANVVLFLKEALKKRFPQVAFTDDADKANVKINIKRLHYWSGWNTVNAELICAVNGKEIIANGDKKPSFMSNLTEEETSESLKNLAARLVGQIDLERLSLQ